jgi:hypothetical protein
MPEHYLLEVVHVVYRPGDVKDFVKKIKLEENRIEMRKKTLARQAERIATARAKSAGTSSGTPGPTTQETAVEQTKPATPATATGSPLHPSLPAKPGSASPSKTSESSQAQPTPTPTTPTPVPAQTERIPTPTPAPAPATPPVITPSDEQILKLEEVTLLSIRKNRTRDLKLSSFCRLQNKQRWAWLALRTARDQHLAQFAKIGVGDIVALAAEIDREREARENTATQEHGASPLPDGKQGVGAQDAAVKLGNDATAKDADGDVKMEG